MTTAEKKQAILNVIYERAYELVEKAEEIRSAFTKTEEPQQEAAETEQPDFFGEVCKLIDNEPKQPETTLKEEIEKTVDFFKNTDVELFGEVTEHTKQIENIQGARQPETVETYTNLADMEAAAKSGKVISLLNMFELVNAK